MEGVYIFINKRYGLALAASDNDTVIGASQDDRDLKQNWARIRGEVPGTWLFKNMSNGKFLELPPNAVPEDGTPVVVDYQEFSCFVWGNVEEHPAWVKLFVPSTKFNAELSRGAPGTPVTLWETNDGAHQIWNMIRVDN